jgi:colanic acid biosynthesis glycosyl transferase WcaI
MRVLVHDYSGHPFQAELSRELASRGHQVVHSTCNGYVSGKGNLGAAGDDRLRFETIGRGPVRKTSFVRRSLQETGFGLEFIRQLRREKPEVVMIANAPVPMLVLAALYLAVFNLRWVLWHQDVQAVAIRSFAGDKLPARWRMAARLIELGERWASRRADHVVVIAEAFVAVHEQWGTADKVTVIPNWAPLDEIVPTERDNAWAKEHGLDGGVNLVYSGTLGLKHNPALLAELAARVRELGVEARLVVVNEGPAVEVVRDAGLRLGVPTTLLPFQPYEQLSEVFGSADVLVVLLEKSAGAFSVPSKTLSYLCAGRPVVGLMPAENLASKLLRDAQCAVFPPDPESVDEAAKWVVEVVNDSSVQAKLNASTRRLAEHEFSREACADQFERILAGIPSDGRAPTAKH